MGADAHIKMNISMTVRATKNLLKECNKVPIDCEIKDDEIHFHYGYWSYSHSQSCESFVVEFCRKNGLSNPEWGY